MQASASQQVGSVSVKMPGRLAASTGGQTKAAQHSNFWKSAPKWWAIFKLWFFGAHLSRHSTAVQDRFCIGFAVQIAHNCTLCVSLPHCVFNLNVIIGTSSACRILTLGMRSCRTRQAAS